MSDTHAPYGYGVYPVVDVEHADGQRCILTTRGKWLRAGEGLGKDARCRRGGHKALHTATAAPDSTADAYDWPTITAEAESLVYGDREGDYGHPREDFTRQAILWTGLLHHKLADGAHLEAEDIARCMIATKLARDVHSPKRDNRVDMAGYAITLDRLETGK